MFNQFAEGQVYATPRTRIIDLLICVLTPEELKAYNHLSRTGYRVKRIKQSVWDSLERKTALISDLWWEGKWTSVKEAESRLKSY